MQASRVDEQIVDFTGDAVICIDASERMFGYRGCEVLGRTLDVLLPSSAIAEHASHVSGFGRGARLCARMGDRGVIAGRRRCGAEFPAQASISLVRVGGEDIYTAIIRDLTDDRSVTGL